MYKNRTHKIIIDVHCPVILSQNDDGLGYWITFNLNTRTSINLYQQRKEDWD